MITIATTLRRRRETTITITVRRHTTMRRSINSLRPTIMNHQDKYHGNKVIKSKRVKEQLRQIIISHINTNLTNHYNQHQTTRLGVQKETRIARKIDLDKVACNKTIIIINTSEEIYDKLTPFWNTHLWKINTCILIIRLYESPT